MGTADGMAYLHALKPPIVHGDLRAVRYIYFSALSPRILKGLDLVGERVNRR